MNGYCAGVMITVAAVFAALAGQEKAAVAVPGTDSGKTAAGEDRAGSTVSYSGKSGSGKGNFYIKSEPAGATVFLNGKMVRNVVTPLTIEDLPAGAYTIRAEKEKFARSVDAALRASEFRRIELVLEKKKGRLCVTTEPPQADVYLGGEFKGKTPLTLDAVDVGEYTLQVKKEGFLEYAKAVEISDVGETRLEAGLVKPGPLKVMSTPMEAEVWLDNVYKGATPMVLSGLSLETHCLELRKNGYAVFYDTLTLGSDRETKVEPTLVLLPVPRPAALAGGREEGVGNRLDRSFKWITVAGGVIFAVIAGVVLAR
jgi:hypothetical protein